MKRISYTEQMTPSDQIDITVLVEKGKVIRFALNYRAEINNVWREIYRIDNHHGFLHEQKLWRDPKPICIEETIPSDLLVKRMIKDIIMNHQKYRRYFEENETNKKGP